MKTIPWVDPFTNQPLEEKEEKLVSKDSEYSIIDGIPKFVKENSEDPQYDIEISKAIRGAVGDEMKLMLDSMWAYQYEDAIRVGRAIENLNFYWYEDPLVEEDIYSYKKLNRKLDIPIIATEYIPFFQYLLNSIFSSILPLIGV